MKEHKEVKVNTPELHLRTFKNMLRKFKNPLTEKNQAAEDFAYYSVEHSSMSHDKEETSIIGSEADSVASG